MYSEAIVIEIKPGETLNLKLTTRKKTGVVPGRSLAGKATDKSNDKPLANARVDLHKTMLYLTRQLRCFEQPDTNSTRVADLPEDDYPVVEIKRNHPNDGTDYVRIRSSSIPAGEGWICSRFKANHYALLFDKKVVGAFSTTDQHGDFRLEAPESQLCRVRVVMQDYFDFESDRVLPDSSSIDAKMVPASDSVQESSIVNRVKDFANFSYVKPPNATYPYSIPGVSIKVAGAEVPDQPGTFYERQNNCCTFVEGLLVKAWKDALGAKFEWSESRHSQMMVQADDAYSPVTAIVESGMGVAIDADELPSPWTIVQHWRNPLTLSGGHTYLVVDVHEETRRVLILESNMIDNLDGPGFRILGDIDKFSSTDYGPGSEWWKNSKVKTWEQITASRPHRKMARLKVYDLQWVK